MKLKAILLTLHILPGNFFCVEVLINKGLTAET